jgi:integrase
MVSMLIAQGKWKDSYKANLCDFYNHYCKHYNIRYVKARYRRDHKIPKVPPEEKIDQIIAHSSKKYAITYSIIKECGLRPVEVGNLSLNDIDLEKGSISVYTAKNGEPRILKLKDKTLAMLTEYIKRGNFGLKDRVFPPSSVISNTYERLRTSLANKLKAPELRQIRLYDLRHFYATMLYHRTKDILLVKEKLGHRNINNTLIYTHLVDFNENDAFYSATAKTVDEAKKLIESGFDYVTEIDGVKLFRKRK